jgi:hypothetical protein
MVRKPLRTEDARRAAALPARTQTLKQLVQVIRIHSPNNKPSRMGNMERFT